MNISARWMFVLFLSMTGLIVLSLNANIEEDRIYLHFAESILNDGDYNILNQVDDKFSWMVTKNYTHPAKHTVIQTPSIILASYLEKALALFTNNSLPKYILSCLFLNLFSFILAFYYCKKSVEIFGYKFNPVRFAAIGLTTSLLYFSYFSFSVFEIFIFCISSYLLYATLALDNVNSKPISGLSFGLCSGLIFISKILYIPLFFLSLIKVIQCLSKRHVGFCANYFLGIIIVLIPFLINSHVQFGSIFLQNATVPSLTFDYSVFNIIQTFSQGYFGVGGLFYTSPAYLPVLIILTYFFGKRIYTKNGDFYTNLFLYLWLVMCFFHSLFFVGPLIEDHYVGRQSLNALPLIVLGYCIILDKLHLDKIKLYVSFCILLLWQFFCMFNFLSYYNRDNHYGYAKNKFAPSIQIFADTIFEYVSTSITLAEPNIIFILLFSMIISLIIYFLLLNFNFIPSIFRWYVHAICGLLIIFSFLNLTNSKENTIIFLNDPSNRIDRVIADSPDLFLFNYIVDILKSQSLNAKSNEARTRINEVRKKYYDHIKGKAIISTPEFDRALETYNYDFKSY
jgi:hypothetical protein